MYEVEEDKDGDDEVVAPLLLPKCPFIDLKDKNLVN